MQLASVMSVADEWLEPGGYEYSIPAGTLAAGKYFLSIIRPGEERMLIPVLVR